MQTAVDNRRYLPCGNKKTHIGQMIFCGCFEIKVKAAAFLIEKEIVMGVI